MTMRKITLMLVLGLVAVGGGILYSEAVNNVEYSIDYEQAGADGVVTQYRTVHMRGNGDFVEDFILPPQGGLPASQARRITANQRRTLIVEGAGKTSWHIGPIRSAKKRDDCPNGELTGESVVFGYRTQIRKSSNPEGNKYIIRHVAPELACASLLSTVYVEGAIMATERALDIRRKKPESAKFNAPPGLEKEPLALANAWGKKLGVGPVPDTECNRSIMGAQRMRKQQ